MRPSFQPSLDVLASHVRHDLRVARRFAAKLDPPPPQQADLTPVERSWQALTRHTSTKHTWAEVSEQLWPTIGLGTQSNPVWALGPGDVRGGKKGIRRLIKALRKLWDGEGAFGSMEEIMSYVRLVHEVGRAVYVEWERQHL